MKTTKRTGFALMGLLLMPLCALAAEQWEVFETSFTSGKHYDNPFTDVEVDVVFEVGDKKWVVPAFWAGGDQWTVRFAPPEVGEYSYQATATDKSNKGLNTAEQTLKVTAYTGPNPLYRHGKIEVSESGRHFQHADGTPFFWLGDTWWKCLAKRLNWEGFQELAADRKKKGFSVVQIVAGPYPDEDAFEEMWKNEGGWPYHTRDYKQLNPEYWNYADRRLLHLIDSELVPAIVGAWGRRDCDAMRVAGVDGLKRHWRYLIARYGAYPVMWILGGELPEETKAGKGSWAEVASYLRSIDPYQHPLTCHTGYARKLDKDDVPVIGFDMVGGGGHDENRQTMEIVSTAYAIKPPMPVLIGETCYEGHMQQGFGDVQRRVFWQSILSGAAGHTYGAAGIWHASVEGDPGCASSGFGGRRTYDWTTWREGMNYPGASQVGLGRKLLLRYPWHHFTPHPEWAEQGSFAAGIPGEVRFIYQPRRGIYNWKGPIVKQLETDITYSAYYFDPATGRCFDAGIVEAKGAARSGLTANIDGHTEAILFADTFDKNAVGAVKTGDASAWRDYGSATKRRDGQLLGAPNMLTINEKLAGKDMMVSAGARSDAEAGLVLRFQDPDNYVVAFYSPQFKGVAIHDRRNGKWGEALGKVATPGIGPNIQLTAAVSGDYAAFVISDGKKTWRTPAVRIANSSSGKTGLWFYQIGKEQAFENFEVSKTTFQPKRSGESGKPELVDVKLPDLPSPQDWVVVLEKVTP